VAYGAKQSEGWFDAGADFHRSFVNEKSKMKNDSKILIFSRWCFHGLGFKCICTGKWCFSYITTHPLCVLHNTTGFIILKPRPTRRTDCLRIIPTEKSEVHYMLGPPRTHTPSVANPQLSILVPP
jgi:hypothetical protein